MFHSVLLLNNYIYSLRSRGFHKINTRMADLKFLSDIDMYFADVFKLNGYSSEFTIIFALSAVNKINILSVSECMFLCLLLKLIDPL